MSETTSSSVRPSLAHLLITPALAFAKVAAQGGVLLVVALVAAMVWRNSSAGADYVAVWATPVRIGIGAFSFELSLMMWINDAAMAVFFLVVGAEIKRELVVGELRGLRRAMVPALAAVGGLVVPAGLYLLIASEHREGFGTPMATDIAFSLAAIRVLGKRVPDFVVKVLMGLAIIDDLGAIIVIAVFYGGDLHRESLALGACLAALLIAMNLFGIWRTTPYVVVGVPLWAALHHGGIHPTIAGVIVGLCIPTRGIASVDSVIDEARGLMALADAEVAKLKDGDVASVFSSLERRLEQHKSPLERLVESLNPLISFVILPVFALANGGVNLDGMSLSTLAAPVSLGVIVGLVVGKQIGIFGVLLACVKSGLMPLPTGVRLPHLWGMSILAGIGFTMSLFVAALAFEDGSLLHNEAKAGILVGSTLALVSGLLVLRFVRETPVVAAET